MVRVLRAGKGGSVIYVNSVFLLMTVIHEFGVMEVRVTIGGGVREVRVGIDMNSSCASLSCHLNSVDVTSRNSPVLPVS